MSERVAVTAPSQSFGEARQATGLPDKGILLTKMKLLTGEQILSTLSIGWFRGKPIRFSGNQKRLFRNKKFSQENNTCFPEKSKFLKTKSYFFERNSSFISIKRYCLRGKRMCFHENNTFFSKKITFSQQNRTCFQEEITFFQQFFLPALLKKVMNSADGIGAMTAPMRIEVPFKIPNRILLGF